MRWQHHAVSILVPATSANLGPGFDALGLAFQLYNRFVLETSTANSFVGCELKYQNKNNAVYQAAQFLFRQYAEDPAFEQPLSITFETSIPTGRGLGSSASCIIGGLCGANLLLGSPFSQNEILQMASIIEGHPDNVAAALYGGLNIVSRTDEGMYYSKNVSVSKELSFFLLVPDFEISTREARDVLDRTVSLIQASKNIANSILLTLALMEGNATLLETASVDYLYEKQRKALIPSFDEIKALAILSGASHFSISGSGPTLLLMARQHHFQLESFKRALANIDSAYMILEVVPDNEGAICQIVKGV